MKELLRTNDMVKVSWVRALLALNAQTLDESLVSETLNVILKYEGDIKKAQGELGRLITRKAEEEAAAPAEEAPKPAAKKGTLH